MIGVHFFHLVGILDSIIFSTALQCHLCHMMKSQYVNTSQVSLFCSSGPFFLLVDSHIHHNDFKSNYFLEEKNPSTAPFYFKRALPILNFWHQRYISELVCQVPLSPYKQIWRILISFVLNLIILSWMSFVQQHSIFCHLFVYCSQ